MKLITKITLMVSLMVTITFAQNYQMDQNVISSGGDQSESDNFKAKCTIGQAIIGTTSSSNSISRLGFWNSPVVSYYPYIPGDCNMALGLWPPSVIGGDVSYLVGYFIGAGNAPCKLNDFWASADVNGDCTVIGGDVSALVGFFIGTVPEILYCPAFEPAWLEGVPDDPPDGWPNCDEPVLNNLKIIPTGSDK